MSKVSRFDDLVPCPGLCHTDLEWKTSAKEEGLCCTWCGGNGKIQRDKLKEIQRGLNAVSSRNGKRTSLAEGLRVWAKSGYNSLSDEHLLRLYAKHHTKSRRWPEPNEALTWILKHAGRACAICRVSTKDRRK